VHRSSQVDAKRTVTLDDQELAAWRKTGTSFVALGGGALVPISRTGGVLAELKLEEMIGNPGTALALQIGYAAGL
jgi:hypothetical protein